VEIQPAYHGADIEGGKNGIQLELGAGNSCAIWNDCSLDDRAKQFGAGGVIKGSHGTARRVDQAMAGGVVGQRAADLCIAYVIDDVLDDAVGFGGCSNGSIRHGTLLRKMKGGADAYRVLLIS